jgi:hypothetical protein
MQFAVTAYKVVKMVTGYLLQQYRKLSEPFLGTWQRETEHHTHIQSNCMRFSINLRKFAKSAKITFGFAKGNLLPFGLQNHDGQCLGSGLLAGGGGSHTAFIILSQIFLLQISRSDSTKS